MGIVVPIIALAGVQFMIVFPLCVIASKGNGGMCFFRIAIICHGISFEQIM